MSPILVATQGTCSDPVILCFRCRPIGCLLMIKLAQFHIHASKRLSRVNQLIIQGVFILLFDLCRDRINFKIDSISSLTTAPRCLSNPVGLSLPRWYFSEVDASPPNYIIRSFRTTFRPPLELLAATVTFPMILLQHTHLLYSLVFRQYPASPCFMSSVQTTYGTNCP